MAENTSNPSRDPTQAEMIARANIGKNVIYFSLGTVGALGIAAIVSTYFVSGEPDKVKEKYNLIRDTFTLLLPVLGTWVGTVLAFYFSRENFAEAASFMKQLTPDQKLQEIPVMDTMILLEDANTAKLKLEKPEDQYKLKDDIIDGLFNKHQKNRLPMIDATGAVKYVVHRSLIDKYITEQALAGNAAVAGATLKDLLDQGGNRKMATSFGVVDKAAKLLAVKRQIDSMPDCSDVFVTEGGSPTAKAVGWITNVMVAEKSKL